MSCWTVEYPWAFVASRFFFGGALRLGHTFRIADIGIASFWVGLLCNDCIEHRREDHLLRSKWLCGRRPKAVVTSRGGISYSTPEGSLSPAACRVIILPGHMCLAYTLENLTKACREVFHESIDNGSSLIYHVRAGTSRAIMKDLAMVVASPSDDATATW
jgi:hypothetical protein